MKKILAVASIVMLWTSGAWALGVTAGTSIGNDATLTYSAGGVVQPPVNTDVPNGQTHSDEFVVDKKIDMVLVTTDSDQLDVAPGQTAQVTNFQFLNEGNADQYFKFEVRNLTDADKTNNNQDSGGLADYNNEVDNEQTVNTMGIEYSTDNGATWTALPTNGVLQVAKDTTVLFKVKSDIPAAPTGADGDVMNIELKATAVTDNTGNTDETESASDDPANVDVVLADGVDHGTLGEGDNGSGANTNDPDTDKDGIELARSGYKIKTPVLTASKKSCVISDPVNNTTNPKRIPGAVIRYMIDIKNTGTGNATGITIDDDIQVNELDYNTIATTNNVHTNKVDQDCVCANESGGTASTVSNTGTSPKVKFEGIKVDGVPANSNSTMHTCVSFDIEIK